MGVLFIFCTKPPKIFFQLQNVQEKKRAKMSSLNDLHEHIQ